MTDPAKPRDRIPYMVTGSIALKYCAVPRTTRDIDVVVELSSGDADRLSEAFRGDFYVDPEAVRRAIEDLIISKRDWARQTRSEVQFADVRNLMASVPDLDEANLAHWTGRLGLDALYREVRG